MRFSILFALFFLALCGYGVAPETTTPATDVQPTIDGYTYKTVKIGEQEWFAENLKTTVYANGEEIPYSRTDDSWTTQEIGMRCSYDHDEARSAQYGQLYNWYAVDDERGLCPSGWHVPSDEEWQDLEVFLGMSKADVSLEGARGSGQLSIGTKLKAKSGWEKGRDGTDDFGFSALPGGLRHNVNGVFYNAGDYGLWWSSSPNNGYAWFRSVAKYADFDRNFNHHQRGHSVRCLRDAD